MGHRSTGSGDPEVSLSLGELERKAAQLCASRGITTDAQWSAAVAAAFDGTNASGLSAQTRAFLIAFFDKFLKVG